MSDLDYDEENETPLMADLRKQLKAANKRVTEAEARAAAAEGTLKGRDLADVLTAKGVNPKAAKFLVLEGVDASDETAVAEWLEENSVLFPATAPAAEPQAQEEQQQEEGPDADTVAAYNNLSNMGAMQRPADMSKLNEVLRTLPDSATPDEVAAAFTKAGI